MSAANSDFSARLRKIEKRNRRLAEGWKPSMDDSGLVTIQPARRIRLPQLTLFSVLCGFFVFKGYLVAALGDAVYSDKIALLDAGTVVEKAGAFVMQADPLTGLLADLIRMVIA